jgi:hypothetical protein
MLHASRFMDPVMQNETINRQNVDENGTKIA